MEIKSILKNIEKRICFVLYYRFARNLPESKLRFGGGKIRCKLCKKIFKSCGDNVNIEKGASFGLGKNIVIGDNSGIGINASIPDGTIIGSNVMMGPNVRILSINHKFDRLDIPMCEQGYTEPLPAVIEDDVWIGRDVLIMRGRTIAKGSIIAAGCVLTKDFPPYSIIGGNPGRVIKSRLSS